MGHGLLYILFNLIYFVVTLVMGDYYSTTELIIQGRRKSLKDKKEQGTTEKRKYQDFLDVMLSAQVNLSNF